MDPAEWKHVVVERVGRDKLWVDMNHNGVVDDDDDMNHNGVVDTPDEKL